MTANHGVLVCGNVVVDILVRPVDRLAWGTTTWVEAIEQHMGGNGANTSYALAKLGTRVRLISAAGTDAFGDEVLASLTSAGVDVSAVRRVDGTTPTTVALVAPNGDRLFLHQPGIVREAFDAPPIFDSGLVAGVGHFHLANLFALPRLRGNAALILQLAREAGLTTSIDTGWDSQGRWSEDLAPCLPHTDLLFVSEEEAQRLGGARSLLERGARNVVVKLGERGCAVFGDGPELTIPGFRVNCVDTTGAGDCFAGAFLAARARESSFEDSARFANAAAALSVEQLGATGGIKGWAETLAWMETARR